MKLPLRLIDTSFIIDLTLSDPKATKIAQTIDEEGSIAAISTVSVHEYVLGVHLAYFEDKEELKTKLEAADKNLMPFMILPLTREIALESARIEAELMRKGQMIGINDIYIAATAINNKASVLTRNASHFRRIEGLSIETY